MSTLFLTARRWRLAAPLIWTLLAFVLAPAAAFGDAQWIWYNEKDLAAVPSVHRYFRKTFELGKPVNGSIELTCDDEYELFVNGKRVGSDDKVETLEKYDLKGFLVGGTNVVAVRARNVEPETPAGLVVRLVVKADGAPDASYASDGSWKCNSYGPRGWETASFNDSKWVAARTLGELGSTLPWKGKIVNDGGNLFGRFTTPPGFKVERVLPPQTTGSLLTLAFNERGDLLAARERGPIVLFPNDPVKGLKDEVKLYSDEITDCQGLLPLNGFVYAVGKGSDGPGLYRLTDKDFNGQSDACELLFKFQGDMAEHGPHNLVLGPEGLIYIAVGNHALPDMQPAPTSPYKHWYEGDLLKPRYEDPGGHAVGVKAPGGTVLRTDADGTFVEFYAGGLRNFYDIAFDKYGELFTFDSDMEWDVGLPWYRPSRVNHLSSGSESGWRSGWATWPAYFVDSLPAAHDYGRGSPAGMAFYEHDKLPAKYKGALIACDWSQGKIVAVTLKKEGSSYTGQSEVLVEGRPLNAVDAVVGPDGGIYFATGGRATEGGVYRLTYEGKLDPPAANTGILAAIRQPQFTSAWGRDKVASLRAEMGDAWPKELAEFVKSDVNSGADRCRGLDLMQLVGPFPSKKFLVRLGQDKDPLVRAKAAYLMGVHFDDATREQLDKMLLDPDANVQRVAAESLLRANQHPTLDSVYKLLGSPQPHLAFSAYRLLQNIPREEWQGDVLTTNNPRAFVMGAAALLSLKPDLPIVEEVVARGRTLLRGYLNDSDFVGVLRVFELALLQGELDATKLAELSSELAEEYPAADAAMNRELVRLLVYLQESSAFDRFVKELSNAKTPIEERIHLAMHLRFMKVDWNESRREGLLGFYESARRVDGGASLGQYIDNAARDFLTLLTAQERGELLASGDRMPGMALQILRSCPTELTAEQVACLVELDERLTTQSDSASSDLKTGIAAILGTSQHPDALAYLRLVYEREPERREEVAMVFSSLEYADVEQAKLVWPLLVRSLPITQGDAAVMVLESLGKIRLRPVKPEPFRQVILLGLRLGEEGGGDAIKVLEHWNGKRRGDATAGVEDQLASWKVWFTEQFPDSPPAELPVDNPNSKWTYQELVDFLGTDDAKSGDVARGSALFAGKGQCIKCHRHGDKGESIGPDLSMVGARFQRREIVESILFPSHVISDQYQSKIVTTTDGRTFTGLVGGDVSGKITILQASGKKIELDEADVEETAASPKSAMPDGLLNTLTQPEIADLFQFLVTPPRAVVADERAKQ